MNPVPDEAAARALGDALRGIGYSEDGIVELLGEDAYDVDSDTALVQERRLPSTPVATAVRALFLQRPVGVDDAQHAFGRRGVDALEQLGLAEVARELVPRSRIVPVEDLLLASDGFSRGEADPPDYVATYTPTSRICDLLTPRPRVARALDVGTGNGIHALLAARHARRVVATDVNPRALAYTQLNAALNGLANVECRRGSLFEPVADETFDLITSNAPFVVSPETRWAYRDGGFRADALSERIVAGAADHLADGGFATVVVSWLAHDPDEPDERAFEWVERTDCDAWLLAAYGSDPLSHAAGWNSHLSGDEEAFTAVLDEWTSYFEELGVRWITEGAVILHRRPGPVSPTRSDEVDPEALERADRQIRHAFAARARLASLRRSELPHEPLAPAMPLVVERELGSRRARIRLDGGTCSVVETTATAAEALAALDGGRTLAEAGASAQALKLARELLELGALRFV